MNRPFCGQILLVGEGDFSLSVSLLSCIPQHLWRNITSTSLESETTILKHKNASENIQLLTRSGVNVILNTDATRLENQEELRQKKFSRIIFNFPHAGGKSNHKKNRKLLKDFFCSAVHMLEERGEVYVSLCRGQGGTPADRPRRKWHDSWQVVAMATCADLVLREVVPFMAETLSDYSSTGFRSQDKGFNTEGALTHIFVRTDPIQVPDNSPQIPHKSGSQQGGYTKQKTDRRLHEEIGNPINYLTQRLERDLGERLGFHTVAPAQCRTGENLVVMETALEVPETGKQGGNPCLPGELFQDQVAMCVRQILEECPISQESLPVMHCMMGSVPVSCSTKMEEVCDFLSQLVCDLTNSECKLEIKDTKINFSREMVSHNVGEILSSKKGDRTYEIFCLNVDKLAVALFQLPNIRLLWSEDRRVKEIFHRMLTSDPPQILPTVSLYPLVFSHDMSFWENSESCFNEQDFLSVIREVCGDLVVCVELLDRFHSTELNRVSRCYRLQFQSYDRALSYNTSWQLQSRLRLCVASALKVELR